MMECATVRARTTLATTTAPIVTARIVAITMVSGTVTIMTTGTVTDITIMVTTTTTATVNARAGVTQTRMGHHLAKIRTTAVAASDAVPTARIGVTTALAVDQIALR